MLRRVLVTEPLKAAADKSAKDVLLSYLLSDWELDIVEALLGACEAESKADDLGLLDGDGTVITTLLVLIKNEPADAGDAAFVLPLWRRCLQPRLAAAALGRTAFVLLELLKRDTTKADVKAAVKGKREEIETAIAKAEAAGSKVNGARNLLQAADEA